MAQHKVEMVPFGDMDQWVDRQIKESGIIGGNTKNVYEIGPTTVIKGDQVYKNMGGSPWATSNVMAKVAGITKTNTSVFPEKRGDGYCARLDTRMESVKVLGLVNITVLAAGSIFTGSVHEPIKGTKNPQKMLQTGIPFTKKPVALQFDYKVKMSTGRIVYVLPVSVRLRMCTAKIIRQLFCFCKNVGKMPTEMFMPNG